MIASDDSLSGSMPCNCLAVLTLQARSSSHLTLTWICQSLQIRMLKTMAMTSAWYLSTATVGEDHLCSVLGLRGSSRPLPRTRRTTSTRPRALCGARVQTSSKSSRHRGSVHIAPRWGSGQGCPLISRQDGTARRQMGGAWLCTPSARQIQK